jgi:hypothetical protein
LDGFSLGFRASHFQGWKGEIHPQIYQQPTPLSAWLLRVYPRFGSLATFLQEMEAKLSFTYPLVNIQKAIENGHL